MKKGERVIKGSRHNPVWKKSVFVSDMNYGYVDSDGSLVTGTLTVGEAYQLAQDALKERDNEGKD